MPTNVWAKTCFLQYDCCAGTGTGTGGANFGRQARFFINTASDVSVYDMAGIIPEVHSWRGDLRIIFIGH